MYHHAFNPDELINYCDCTLDEDYQDLKRLQLKVFTWAKDKVYAILAKETPQVKECITIDMLGCIYTGATELDLALQGKPLADHTFLEEAFAEENQYIENAYSDYTLSRLKDLNLVDSDHLLKPIHRLFTKYLQIIRNLRNNFAHKHGYPELNLNLKHQCTERC